MVNRNSSCSAPTRLDRLRTQVHKLDSLSLSDDARGLEQFDAETEDLLIEAFGTASESLEAYKYAMVGDDERLIIMTSPAQTGTSQKDAYTRLPHRRQILEGCVSILEAETQENVPHRSPLK
jgi:hypothetical protein